MVGSEGREEGYFGDKIGGGIYCLEYKRGNDGWSVCKRREVFFEEGSDGWYKCERRVLGEFFSGF